jgi:hypothetical protein
MKRPDWMVPGAEVAILTTRNRAASVKFTTIDRVLKRDLVLTNGDRFNADRPSKRSGGTWDGRWSEVIPADDPRVVDVLEHKAFEQQRRELRELMAGWSMSLKDAGDQGELTALWLEMREALDNFGSPPLDSLAQQEGRS